MNIPRVRYPCALRLYLIEPLIVTVIRIAHPHDPFATPVVECALLECEAIDEMENEPYSQSAWFEVLDMRFYDNESLAMVIQSSKAHERR
jgi:hypothetical protein